MLRRILNMVTGKTDDTSSDSKKKRKAAEPFSLEFCKVEAKIAPDGDCIIQHITSGELIFKSSRALQEGSQITLQINYFPLKKGQYEDFESLDVALCITQKGEVAPDTYLYKCAYVNSNDAKIKLFFKYLKDIETLQLHQKVDYKDRRAHTRVNRVLPVFSKHLKTHKGLTKNISCGGLMLSCGGGVKKGDIITFRLELDDYSVDALDITGEICWIDEKDPNQVLIGIRFINLNENEARIIANYVESIIKTMAE